VGWAYLIHKKRTQQISRERATELEDFWAKNPKDAHGGSNGSGGNDSGADEGGNTE
jgi:hypothetical protein